MTPAHESACARRYVVHSTNRLGEHVVHLWAYTAADAHSQFAVTGGRPATALGDVTIIRSIEPYRAESHGKWRAVDVCCCAECEHLRRRAVEASGGSTTHG